MKLKYHGHACFSMQFECGAKIVCDPFDPTVTFAPCTEECDAAILSHDHFDHNYTASLSGNFETIASAGERIINGTKIRSIPCFHDKEGGALRGRNLVSIIECEGLKIAHLGDLGHMPDESMMAQLSGIDVMLIPIGGTYTIDTPEAEELIRAAKPRIAVAMHFKTEAYEIKITTCEAFKKDMMAANMPNEIEITEGNISKLPPVIIMDYK